MSNTMDTWFTSAASNQIRPTPFFKRILASKRAPLCMRSFLQNMLTSDIVIECIYYFINAQYNTPKFYGILSHGEDVAAHRLQRWQRSPPNRYQRRSFSSFPFYHLVAHVTPSRQPAKAFDRSKEKTDRFGATRIPRAVRRSTVSSTVRTRETVPPRGRRKHKRSP